MGFLGGKKRSRSSGSKPPYADDGARPMPTMLDPTLAEGARDKRLKMVARSGRASTNLSGTSGTRPYVNTFIGGVQ